MTGEFRAAIATAFEPTTGEAAKHLWTCDDATFAQAAPIARDWWAGGYFGPAYEAVAARFPRQDGRSEAERTRQEVDTILGLLGGGSKRFLDMPCGNGRHARELAVRGHEVVGMDLQESLVRRLRPLPCAVADMRRLPVADGVFDAVLNLWNSFGYFLDEAEDIAVLAGFRRALRPGGVVVLHSDLDVRPVAEGGWIQHMKVPLGDGVLFLVRQVPASVAVGTGLICLSWVIFPDEPPWQSPAWFMRAIDDAGWHRLATAAGFTEARIQRTPSGVVPHETLISLMF